MSSFVFADLSEAYADIKIAAPIPNKMTDPSYQTQVLERVPEQSPSTLQAANVKRFITNTFLTKGIAGVKELIDPAIIRDIQTAAAVQATTKQRKGTAMDFDVDTYVFMLISSLVLLILVDTM